MRILLDVDGVLADFTGTLCSALVKEGFDSYKDEDLTEWELNACFPPECHDAISRIMTRPGFFASIPRYAGAQAFYRDLCRLGEVTAVTTVKGRAQQERYDWLLFFGFADHNIILVEDHDQKAFIPGEVLIDDRIETLWKCPHKKNIVFDRPWNRRPDNGVLRAYSYQHVLDLVKA